MSIHSSLRGVDNLAGARSVFTRIERLQALAKLGKFAEDKSSVFGLPKVRTRFKTAKKVKAPKPEAGAAAAVPGAPGAPAAPGAAPAASKGAGAAATPAAGKGEAKEGKKK